ncbi:MAG TPA: polysaccharide deacetylase family protein [Candidatus Saccharimonadales bacterium]
MNKQLKRIRTFLGVIWHDILARKPRGIAIAVCAVLAVVQISIITLNAVNSRGPVVGLRLDGQVINPFGGDYQRYIHQVTAKKGDTAVTIKASNYTTTITPRQLGAGVDETQLHQTLLRQGRTGNILQQLFEQDAAALGFINISSHLQPPDKRLTTAFIALLDSKIDTRPGNAYFEFINQKVSVHDDTDGIALNSNQAIESISKILADDHPATTLSLPIAKSQATVTTPMLASVLPQVQAIAQQPLTITAGSGSTTLSQQQLVGLVVPKVTQNPKDPKKPTVQISFDTAKLNAIVDGVVAPAVVAPQPTIVNRGKVVRPGTSGLQPQDDHPITSVMSALLQRQTGSAAPTTVQVPMVKVDPPTVPAAAVPTPAPQPSTGTRGTGTVYLTFDDGPGQYTEQVLDILKKYNVHATFYLIGRNVQSYPQSVARIVKEGHTVGNHSFTHRDLSTLSAAEVLTELTSTQQAIKQASGVAPVHFRPPYGAQNQTVKNQAASLGLSDDMWSVDPRDWSQPGSSAITQRVLSQTGAGSVVLLHVLHQQTVDSLPAIIEGIRAKGYTLQ